MGCGVSRAQQKEQANSTSENRQVLPKIEIKKENNESNEQKEIAKQDQQRPSLKDFDLKIEYNQFVNAKFGSYEETYELGTDLGPGIYSTVKKVMHKENKEVRAMKIISKKLMQVEAEQKQILTDLLALKTFDHPNIPKVFDFFVDNENYYIVTELFNGGELFERLSQQGALSENEAAQIIKQILSLLNYIHKNNIVHRDIRLENILLDNSVSGSTHIKVIAWGSSRKLEHDKSMNEFIGSNYYMAPEILKKSYNQKVDIWACGVILYALIAGEFPFNADNQIDIFKQIYKGKVQFQPEKWKNISEDCRKTVELMLTYDYNQRPNAEQLLQNPWIISHQQIVVNENVQQQNIFNLKKHKYVGKFQQAILAYFAIQSISKDQRDFLNETFKQLDTNNDGLIDQHEILEGFKQYMNAEEAELEVNLIMKQLDIDQSGSINYTEFIAATMSKNFLNQREKLKQAFDFFDIDKSGKITYEELKQIFGNNGNDHVSDDVWKNLISKYDTNKDGGISFEEFIELVNTIEKQK